jgi:hypothetical protein
LQLVAFARVTASIPTSTENRIHKATPQRVKVPVCSQTPPADGNKFHPRHTSVRPTNLRRKTPPIRIRRIPCNSFTSNNLRTIMAG